MVATPSAATKEPTRRWVGEADDAHLHNIVDYVFDKYGRENIQSFWLVGHSQGGMTSNRLLRDDPFFQDRVDGWLSLSGGRMGPAERAEGFGPPLPPGQTMIKLLPATSPWADKYGAGPRERRPDIVDTEAGQIHDTGRQQWSTKGWGLLPRPGTAEMWVYPGAKDGRVIADVVRLDKGHTEGLEPHVTEALVKLIVSAAGGKAQALKAAASAG